jgi:hypothetical protein
VQDLLQLVLALTKFSQLTEYRGLVAHVFLGGLDTCGSGSLEIVNLLKLVLDHEVTQVIRKIDTRLVTCDS